MRFGAILEMADGGIGIFLSEVEPSAPPRFMMIKAVVVYQGDTKVFGFLFVGLIAGLLLAVGMLLAGWSLWSAILGYLISEWLSLMLWIVVSYTRNKKATDQDDNEI